MSTVRFHHMLKLPVEVIRISCPISVASYGLAYDRAAIKVNGNNAVTNFDPSTYAQEVEATCSGSSCLQSIITSDHISHEVSSDQSVHMAFDLDWQAALPFTTGAANTVTASPSASGSDINTSDGGGWGEGNDDSEDGVKRPHVHNQNWTIGTVSINELGKAAERWPGECTGWKGICKPETWGKLKKSLRAVMFVVAIQTRVRSLQLWKKKSNHGSASADELGKAIERWPKKSFAFRELSEPEIWNKDMRSDVSELAKLIKRQKLAGNQFRHITSREKLQKCLNVVKFVVRIQVGIRGRQVRKYYTTHGSTVTDEPGTARVCSKDVETDAGVTESKVVRWQKLDKYVRSSTSKEEDSFYPKHKYLHSKGEKPQSTFRENVNKWIVIKRKYGSGLHHTCVEQVGPELGRNVIKQVIMEKILLDKNGGNSYTVICINAGIGHGKTSLLRVLYNDQQLVDAFDKRIWIQMSDQLDISMLFRKILEFTMNDHCSITNLRYLQKMVEEEITDKKIVLFLDDADIEDQKFWNTALEVLHAGAKGSIVIIATVSATVAALTGISTHSYFLSPLSRETNLMLLQQSAALGTDIQRIPDLMMIAKRLISMPGVNPLNLKVIGGLLCHTNTISLLQNDKIEPSVLPLQLCHDVLPICLKNCLAFCSLFPQGYIFDKHDLIHQWISHGCVSPDRGSELEDVGAEYFNELQCRSFFQKSPFHDDKDQKFVIHKLIKKVVEFFSRNRYFKSEDLLSSGPENILHLSLVPSQFQTVQLMSITEKLKDLQTFLVVKPEGQEYKISVPALNLVGLCDFFLKFKSMETLDLSYTGIEELPGSIVSMKNLRYLSVNNTSIKALPSELCSLSNLQTLKAKYCRFLTELPEDTKKLLKLRHLDVTKDLGYVHLPHGIGHLTELRTLSVFHASGHSSHCFISELGNLQSLRGCLQLSGLECVKVCSKAQEVNLKDKQHLQNVTLQWHDGGADIGEDDDDEAEHVAEQVLQVLEPHVNLQVLAIRGYEGTVFPSWMQGPSSLPNLISLTLDGCCNCTQFPTIAQLPSLKFLGVRKMYDVQRLSRDVNGIIKFPSLEVLNIWEMYGLEELFHATEHDCPRLRKICVSRCPDLKSLPSIPSLVELVLHFCHQLPDIPDLGSLATLKIEGFHGVRSFSLTPAALPVLEKLEIRSCNELSRVHGLEALTTVQRLKIAGCPKLVLPSSGLAS